MWNKLTQFWRAPLLSKVDNLGTAYYRVKGVVLYRALFRKFGKRSHIRKPLLILNPKFMSIGDRVSIRDGVRLEVVRSDDHTVPSLSIGDDTNIEQNVHIVCHSRIQIGRNVSITGHCAIVDVTHPFEDVHDGRKIGARIKNEHSFVEIGDGSFIGYGSVILPNVRVGTYVVIGANSVVAGDVPDYSVAAGVPAIILKRYDQERKRWVRAVSAPSGGGGS
jgi:acetyltransferase-like isoleucine patch superfamily enzyme